MNCWKTINIKKHYGVERVFLLSSFIVLLVFSFTYTLQEILNKSHKSDDYFGLFLIGLISIYPIHKILHFLPLFSQRNNVKLLINIKYKCIPSIIIRVCEPINKNRFLFSLLAPFIFLNSIIIMGALYAPNFAHYFTILFAYHCGLCLMDLIYVKNLSKSPKSAFIEETDFGYQILIKQNR